MAECSVLPSSSRFIVFLLVSSLCNVAKTLEKEGKSEARRIWLLTASYEESKEYVVEDLHGSYSTPKMDPEHERRLKMLQLL